MKSSMGARQSTKEWSSWPVSTQKSRMASATMRTTRFDFTFLLTRDYQRKLLVCRRTLSPWDSSPAACVFRMLRDGRVRVVCVVVLLRSRLHVHVICI